MEKIKGFDIPFDISKLKLRANLIEQDGPLLSLYYNRQGDYYLFYWLDCNTSLNRWMILRTDVNTLYKYLAGESTLLQVIKGSADGFVWITDIDNEGKQTDSQAVPVASIPSDYLPDDDSWFEFDHQKELLKDVATDEFEVKIPKSDKGLFSTIMSKMGWKLSPRYIHKFIDKVAL